VSPDVDPFDLERFVRAQHLAYAGALAELRAGRKTGHWIWYVFPQIVGLGSSAMSTRFAIGSLEEARAYLGHPVLGSRLRECAKALLGARGRTATQILGDVDAMKVHSSMTLFHRAAPDESLFRAVLDGFFAGAPDPRTDDLLG
jgi:uncharacterized protein (DUF1810 family)